jgi:uncharacterized membrane protein YbhN (UPF0104 family)
MLRGASGIATVALGVAAVVCIPVGISLFFYGDPAWLIASGIFGGLCGATLLPISIGTRVPPDKQMIPGPPECC